jgi:hypothetical protein
MEVSLQPPEKSVLDFGWEDQNGLSPVYFVGQTFSDFLKELLCTSKGESSCLQELYVHFIITIFICNLSQRVATCTSPLTLT